MKNRKGEKDMETINPPVCCLFLVSSTFFGFCDFPFPFSCNITEARVNSYFYDLVHPSHLTCCVLICLYQFTYNNHFEDLAEALLERPSRVTPPILVMNLFSLLFLYDHFRLMHCSMFQKFAFSVFYFPNYESNLSNSEDEKTYLGKNENQKS